MAAVNRYERAIVEAARTVVDSGPADPDGAPFPEWHVLVAAVEALDAAALPREVEWHEVAEGDQLRSANNGRFYPVIGVIALNGGGRQITIDLAGSPKAIVRPTEKEPRATVRRGDSGRAVDTFVNVFTSGA